MKNEIYEKLVSDISRIITENLMKEQTETALCITLPKTVRWSDYEDELAAVADGTQEMNYRLSSKPGKVCPGDRCYICHDGYLIGWMRISDISYKDDFECTTTGEFWKAGWYVSRTGPFHYLSEKIPMKGFMGFRYIKPV